MTTNAEPSDGQNFDPVPQKSADFVFPAFTEAVAEFAAFLESEHATGRILWIDREDVTSHRRRFWLRIHDPNGAERRALARYHIGRNRGLGVSLRAVCRAGGFTACYVWSPVDEVDASYAMHPRSLKFQVPTPLESASIIRSRVPWILRNAINRRRRFGNLMLDDIPPRATAQKTGGPTAS